VGATSRKGPQKTDNLAFSRLEAAEIQEQGSGETVG